MSALIPGPLNIPPIGNPKSFTSGAFTGYSADNPAKLTFGKGLTDNVNEDDSAPQGPAGSLVVNIITTSVPACVGCGVNSVFNAVGSAKLPNPSSVLHVAEVANPPIVPFKFKSSLTHTVVLKPAVTIAAGSTVTNTSIAAPSHPSAVGIIV